MFNHKECLNQLTMSQFGHRRLVSMIGAKHFSMTDNSISFQFMKNTSKANWITITLNASDTYDVEFFKIFKFDKKVIEKFNGVYNDQLKEIFENVTGLYLSL